MKIETIILAGGKSSRMGKDKALLKFQGQPLITHIYRQVISVSEQLYIVTPWADKYRHLLPSSNDHCRFIQESIPHQGPLFAFAEVLPSVETDWVLLLACDLPYIRVGVINLWVTQLAQIPSSSIAFLAPNQKGWECLCGFYRRTCLDSLTNYLTSGQKSFQRWLKEEQVTPMLIDNKHRIFFNCNTPDEYYSLIDDG